MPVRDTTPAFSVLGSFPGSSGNPAKVRAVDRCYSLVLPFLFLYLADGESPHHEVSMSESCVTRSGDCYTKISPDAVCPHLLDKMKSYWFDDWLPS
ncbi:hypothetical protein RRG08_007960 [Elysia crispata]|uniref:Uncharacterized protein n=1 Tax=Elysia crispata TaxID=231223 RepID=A0AAE1DL71_9GAST|nr:hypothetical protein RRG08_007960 [Elysia crispata]